jgi:hypothetical protein
MASQISGHLSSPAYESIATTTVGSGGQATVDFTSIVGTYKHLQVRLITRNNRASQLDGLYIRFNSDSATNYSAHFLRGDGATVDANADVTISYMLMGTVSATNATASVFSAGVIDILDYANTNKYKTVRSLTGYDANGSGYFGLFSGNWRSTSAVTSITLGSTNGSGFLEYSKFALYGIK